MRKTSHQSVAAVDGGGGGDPTGGGACGQQQQQQRKRGLSRFSLRRLLYASPLGGRRVTRNTSSGSSKSQASRQTSVKDATTDSRGSTSSGPTTIVTVNRTGGHVSDEVRFVVGELRRAVSRNSVFTTGTTKSSECYTSGGDVASRGGPLVECPLCLAELPADEVAELSACGHKACATCLRQYLRIEISESRVCVACPECAEPMHPNEIRAILDDPALYEKYEDFMVRRVLAVDPDTRWCPAPDCSYAVIASGCASCPKLHCERPGCDYYFCYHCKAEWHPNQTCDAARAQRSPNVRSSSVSFSQDSRQNDIKPCPRCQVLIVKMDDGSCNHMMCAVCGAEFCWLCMKEISDLHYLSPSGCTFWGKKPWSRKKKILWQLGTLVGAPVGIALVAGIAVPAMIIGIPVWVGRKLYTRYRQSNKHKRNAAIVGGVTASVLVAPVLAGLAVGIGVPILLFYVYGVVPVSLCRSGGCGVSTSGAGVRFEFDDENDFASQLSTIGSRNPDNSWMDSVLSRSGANNNPSIGEASLSLVSGSQTLVRGAGGIGGGDHDSAISTVAMAGSLSGGVAAASTGTGGGAHGRTGHHQHRLEVHADVQQQRFSSCSSSEDAASSTTNASLQSASDKSSVCMAAPDDGAASTRALAGSVFNYKQTASDTCSWTASAGGGCASGDAGSDCVSVRFDDNVSFISAGVVGHQAGGQSQQHDRLSVGSTRSWRSRASCDGVVPCSAATVRSCRRIDDCDINARSSKPSSIGRCDTAASYSDGVSEDSVSIDMAPCPVVPSPAQQQPPPKPARSAATLRSLFFHSTTTTTAQPSTAASDTVTMPSTPVPNVVSIDSVSVDLSEL